MNSDQRVPRTALVTGAAKRIGRAIALGLADDGFALALHCGQSRAEAQDLAAEIIAKGGRVQVFHADLRHEDQVAALLPTVTAVMGPVGVLVNNASVFERDEAMTATRASWDLHMEVNCRAPMVLSLETARLLPPQSRAVIINMLDQRVWNLTPHFTSYTVSKAALWTLTQTLAGALAPRIRVVGIGPGPVLPSYRQTQTQFDAQVNRTPLREVVSLDEIVATVRFVLGAATVTGQMIALDSGQHLDWAPGGIPADE